MHALEQWTVGVVTVSVAMGLLFCIGEVLFSREWEDFRSACVFVGFVGMMLFGLTYMMWDIGGWTISAFNGK
jgi:hypothetical protein